MQNALKPFSNNQIDKLGERLKAGDPSDEDVTMLSAYRNSFFDAAKSVADTVREISGLEVTARSLKTTLSIVAKLKRDGVKQLSAMQDIGGCRVTVANLTEQDELTEKLMTAFPDAKLYDRVAKPSHGYRAKHLVVKVDGRRIEIQIRTFLQNIWALFSEAMADELGQNLKYGHGMPSVVKILHDFAFTLHKFDLLRFDSSNMTSIEPSNIRNIVSAAHAAVREQKRFENSKGMK
jgi:ppGpp synthetase/RelA/SpoT-type nucleotidyltranferase